MRRPLSAAFTTVAVVVTTLLGSPAAAAPTPEPGAQGLPLRAAPPSPQAKVAPSLADAVGTVTAFVQLAAPSTADVAATGATAAAVDAAEERIEALADAVVPAAGASARAGGATAGLARVSVTTNVIAGTVVRGDAAKLRELADSPDVTAVYRVVPKTIDNEGTDVFTRALQTWQDTGATGAGIRVGIIDTGIDYTHANFGGPGTVEAYEEAYGTDGAGPVPAGSFDPLKYLGGHDFAGPRYDATVIDPLPGSSPIPAPDENPIDAPHTAGGGHGSHVAGTAAGYGVDPDGKTFGGDYGDVDESTDWRIGPGSAPEAGVYSLKVFGDIGGSTDLTIEALDWALDPNDDNDFNDHLDVLNLSLGAAGSPADDPENLFVDHLADLGVLSVFSAGNEGDITDIGGLPGSSRSGLTVAWSVGETQTFDAVEVTEAPDAALVGRHAAQLSVLYAGTADVTAPVEHLGDDVSGCRPLTEFAAELAGKIAYLWWDDDDSTRECGSAVRWNNAEAAGAVGVLLGTELATFPAGIAGNATIPGAQLTAAATDALLPAIETDGVVMRIGPSLANAALVRDETLADTLSTSSSRGVHGTLGIIKPDVAAPGNRIASTASGTGTEVLTISGTSMASPHVAGIAALVRATHPDWTPAQVKADVMNTATHDVHAEPGQSGPVFGPARVGSGRVDTLDAVRNTTIAYASEDPDLVSVTFGVVPVGAETVVRRKTVTVENLGSARVRYDAAFDAATTTGGAAITASPSTVELDPGERALVTLTLTADPATLARDLDATSAAEYDLGIPVPREYVAALSGRLVLTSGDTELRVPVQAAPRLVSDLTAQPVTFTQAGDASAPLNLTGRAVSSGGWTSLVAPMELVATSPQLEASDVATSHTTVAAGDVRHVGFASTAPQLAALDEDPGTGTIGIGIATQGEWPTLGAHVLPVVDIDVDGDGDNDFQTRVRKFSADVDLTVAATFTAAGRLVDALPVNGAFGDVDTSVFDNNVVVIPIGIETLGVEPGQTPTFTVRTVSDYATDGTGVVDRVEPFTADPYEPEYWFGGTGADEALLFGTAPGAPVTVHRTAAADEEPSPLLVLHTHNATTVSRAQVVDVRAPVSEPTTTTLAVTGDLRVGSDLTLTATVDPAAATGTVTFLDGGSQLGEAEVRDGTASTTVRLGAGDHSLTARFEPDSTRWAGSTSAAVSVGVAQATSGTTLQVSDRALRFGQAATGTVEVTATAGSPSGTVEIRAGSDVVASGELAVDGRRGTVRLDLPRDLAVGAHALTAVFVGNADVAGSTSPPVRVRVVAATPDVSLGAQSWTVERGSTPTVTVTVVGEPGAPAPTGRVTVLVNLQQVESAELGPDGTVEVTLPPVRHRSVVSAVYGGDAGYRPAVEMRTLRVR